MDRVVPIKQERPDLGGSETDVQDVPADVNEDALEARGFYVQNDSSRDSLVLMSRDDSNNITFTDPVTGTKTLAQLAAGGANIIEVEVNFGSTPVRAKSFVITDAGVSTASQILAMQSSEAATGRSEDENEMETLIVRCTPGAGQFTAYLESLQGALVGIYKLNYLVG